MESSVRPFHTDTSTSLFDCIGLRSSVTKHADLAFLLLLPGSAVAGDERYRSLGFEALPALFADGNG